MQNFFLNSLAVCFLSACALPNFGSVPKISLERVEFVPEYMVDSVFSDEKLALKGVFVANIKSDLDLHQYAKDKNKIEFFAARTCSSGINVEMYPPIIALEEQDHLYSAVWPYKSKAGRGFEPEKETFNLLESREDICIYAQFSSMLTYIKTNTIQVSIPDDLFYKAKAYDKKLKSLEPKKPKPCD